MKTLCLLALTVSAGQLARADFSYTTTTKSSGGMMGMAGGQSSTTYLKGQRMKIDSGTSSTIFDFDSQTITHIDNSRKSYSVSKFSDMSDTLQKTGAQVSVDVKETGEQKVINGMRATEIVMTTQMDSNATRQAGADMKVKMEMHIWLSSDVPGAQEMRNFYQKNGDKFPWAGMGGGGRGQGMQGAMNEVRRKMASMKGVPVLQVMKMDLAGGNDAQTAKIQQGMAQMQKQFEEMKRQGKLPPQLEQQLARMQASGGGAGGPMAETTMESSGFSTSSIPGAVFEIPAGYQQTQKSY